MGEQMSFDDIGLSAAVDGVIEFAEEVRVTRVLADHPLNLEAEIVVGRFRIERTLDGKNALVVHRPVGAIVEQASPVEPVIWVAKLPVSLPSK